MKRVHHRSFVVVCAATLVATALLAAPSQAVEQRASLTTFGTAEVEGEGLIRALKLVEPSTSSGGLLTYARFRVYFCEEKGWGGFCSRGGTVRIRAYVGGSPYPLASNSVTQGRCPGNCDYEFDVATRGADIRVVVAGSNVSSRNPAISITVPDPLTWSTLGRGGFQLEPKLSQGAAATCIVQTGAQVPVSSWITRTRGTYGVGRERVTVEGDRISIRKWRYRVSLYPLIAVGVVEGDKLVALLNVKGTKDILKLPAEILYAEYLDKVLPPPSWKSVFGGLKAIADRRLWLDIKAYQSCAGLVPKR